MYAASPQVRPLSALASAVIVFGLALALILALRPGRLAERVQGLTAIAFSVRSPPPPPERARPRRQMHKAAAKGDPAPRALRNRATQVVALPVPFLIRPPLPVPTAPIANLGNAVQTGAAPVPGPGQGAGGNGNGLGGGGEGGYGGGRGSGGGDPVEPPRHVRGKLSFGDVPEGLVPEGREGIVGVLYAVNPDGRVIDCEVERSSGIAALDALVCRLIEQRFVFRPARDRYGRPVRSRIEETHSFFGRPESG